MRSFLFNAIVIMVFLMFLHGQNVFAGSAAAAGKVVDVPMGQNAGGEVSLLPEDVGNIQNNEDLFGSEGGYFHPYITLGLEYTDNLYNIDSDETSNMLTKISPGIWFALPRKKVVPITLAPNNSSNGGLRGQFGDYSGTDRYLAYLLGGVDFNNYSADSDLNEMDGLLEGIARYNLRGGLSFQAVDRFTHGQDDFEIGSSTRGQQRRFDSNFFMATADWDITDKFRAQFDYANFALGYADEINKFLSRVDNGFNLYGYFNYSLKTSFFLEYRFVNAAYDKSTEIDNDSHWFLGGITWNTTEKLALLAKAGYQAKNFDNTSLGYDDYSGFALDIQAIYHFSEKTKFIFDVYRNNEETDNYLASDQTVLGGDFSVNQKFTDKLSASVGLVYEDASYTSVPGQSHINRDDKTFTVEPGVQYLFREWLKFNLSYKYDKRDSDEDFFDFASNTVFLSAAFAL